MVVMVVEITDTRRHKRKRKDCIREPRATVVFLACYSFVVVIVVVVIIV